MTTPKFKIGDRVKWKNPEGRDFRNEVKGLRDDSSGWRYAMTVGGLWWHESHLSLDVPAEPKFKVGDRVKCCDGEGILHHGSVRSIHTSNNMVPHYLLATPLNGWWHESHLSLDVPAEPKQFATKLEAELGVEIIDLHYRVADQKKEIERLTGLNTKHLHDSLELSRRLTEEIGARHRERIAKEAAQKELAQTKENERWCCDKLSELANELSAERVAKTSAQKELANVRAELKASRIDIANISDIAKRSGL